MRREKNVKTLPRILPHPSRSPRGQPLSLEKVQLEESTEDEIQLDRWCTYKRPPDLFDFIKPALAIDPRLRRRRRRISPLCSRFYLKNETYPVTRLLSFARARAYEFPFYKPLVRRLSLPSETLRSTFHE